MNSLAGFQNVDSTKQSSRSIIKLVDERVNPKVQMKPICLDQFNLHTYSPDLKSMQSFKLCKINLVRCSLSTYASIIRYHSQNNFMQLESNQTRTSIQIRIQHFQIIASTNLFFILHDGIIEVFSVMLKIVKQFIKVVCIISILYHLETTDNL